MSHTNVESDISWANLKIGQQVTISETVKLGQLEKFSELSGDRNPLHLDQKYARSRGFQAPVMQGMLLTSFFSALVGNHVPGKHGMFVSLNVDFKKPVLAGETVTISMTVTEKRESTRTAVLDMVVSNVKKEVAVKGQALVKYFS